MPTTVPGESSLLLISFRQFVFRLFSRILLGGLIVVGGSFLHLFLFDIAFARERFSSVP